MKLQSLIVSAAILISYSAAMARTLQVLKTDDPEITHVVIEKIGTERLARKKQSKFMSITGDCSGAPLARTLGLDSGIPSTGDLRIDAIINLGAKAFEIIKANGPLVTATTKTANALPFGVSCWNQLERWSPPRSEVYRVSYKNLYGITVVDFQFRLIYSYGGRIGNTGRYLSNSTIQYKQLDTKWGYVFDANVEIPEVLNVGTRENPVGGMQLTLNWTVSTRPISLRKITNSATFFIAGDGRQTSLLD